MTDKKTIAQIISVMSAAYPNFAPSEATAEIYWQTLRDISEPELRAATLACVAELNRKFAPSVGEIRGKVSDLRTLQRRIPTSYEAWQEVQKAPKDGNLIVKVEQNEDGTWVIYRRIFKWSHPLVERAARLLGWPNFPGAPDDLASDRARFIDCYAQRLEQSSQEDMLLPEIKLFIDGARLLPEDTPKPLKRFLKAKRAKPEA